MSNLTRTFINGLLPTGSAWRYVPSGPQDKLYDGIADNMESTRAFMGTLATIDDPLYTPILSDLEMEYGVSPNAFLTDSQRRANLAVRKYTKAQSTLPAIQSVLNAYGFGVGGYGLQVYDNTGGANPQNFFGGVAYVQMGYTTPGFGWMGNTSAFMGISGGGGTLIVNGTSQSVSPNFWGMGMQTTAGYGYLGNTNAFMGYFTTLTYTPVVYTIPTDPGYWGAFFFLGGTATYIAGVLTSLTYVNIPAARQGELIELITRLKPMWTWAVAMVNWI